MSEFIVNPVCDTDAKHFDNRPDAEDAQDTHLGLCPDCVDESDCPIEASDGGTTTPEVVEESDPIEPAEHDNRPADAPTNDPEATQTKNQVAPEPATDDLPDDPSIQDDPVDWLPKHFIDTIQGVPTVNRKGYAVIASKYNVSVTAEPVTLASETDFEYAEFRAIATTESGEEYSGFGSAHVDRMDGDDQYLLNELAETRALKRATAWSTGVGLTAIEELKGDLE